MLQLGLLSFRQRRSFWRTKENFRSSKRSSLLFLDHIISANSEFNVVAGLPLNVFMIQVVLLVSVFAFELCYVVSSSYRFETS